jgi:hypothetical protein
VEPPEAPLLRADEPWSQPIEEINKTKPARAKNPDKAFNATLAMVLPFISGYPSIDKAVPTCEVWNPHLPSLERMRATWRAELERVFLLPDLLPGDGVATTG